MKRILLLVPFVLAACGPDSMTQPDITIAMAAGGKTTFSADPCTFTVSGDVMSLDGSCSTSTSIVIPDGFTLNGNGHTITAVDAGPGVHFLGAVIRNGGTTAHIRSLHVSANALANACKSAGPPDNRLRGILFDGASGSITHSTVVGINKGASGCQEGNAIEIRNAPFDGTHPNTQSVLIAHNAVTDYQKTGIVCNGDVTCSVRHNDVGSSATQANLAANSVQFGFGAGGDISLNKIAGNSWCGPSDFVATAILLFDAATGSVVESNQIAGNSDVGVYAFTAGVTITKNFIDDVGSDCNVNLYDTGIGDYGPNYPAASNDVTKNKVRGFDVPYDPVMEGGKNQVKKPTGGPAGI